MIVFDRVVLFDKQLTASLEYQPTFGRRAVAAAPAPAAAPAAEDADFVIVHACAGLAATSEQQLELDAQRYHLRNLSCVHCPPCTVRSRLVLRFRCRC